MALNNDGKSEIKFEAPKSAEELEKEAEEERRSKELVSKLFDDPNKNVTFVAETAEEVKNKKIISIAAPIVLVLLFVFIIIGMTHGNGKKDERNFSRPTSNYAQTETKLITTTTAKRADEDTAGFNKFLQEIEEGEYIDSSAFESWNFTGYDFTVYKCKDLLRDENLTASLDLSYEDGIISVNTNGHIIMNGQFQTVDTGVVIINNESNLTAYVVSPEKKLHSISNNEIKKVNDKEVSAIYHNDRYHVIVIRYSDETKQVLRGLDIKKLY
jgi:hypothetical protein